MSVTMSVDYLSLLPSELLEDIFGQVHHSNKFICGPISKTLLPFQQHHLFRDIYIESYEQLDKLCRTAKANLGLMKYVIQLEVDIEPVLEWESEPGSTSKTELEDLLVPSSQEVKNLFKTLEHTHSLSISGSSRLASLVLNSAVSTSSFPSLSNLNLASTFPEFDDPFHPAIYANLTDYNNLDHFSLSVRCCHSTIRLSEKELPELIPFGNKIASVSLAGPLSTSILSIKRLLSSFRSLERVALNDLSPSSRIFDLCHGIDSPKELGFLSLTRPPFASPPLLRDFVAAVPNFTSLDCLVLGGCCSSLSRQFYSSLRLLPLTQMAFESDADVDLNELTNLVAGKFKHETLKIIWFENVKGKIGTRFGAIGDLPPCGRGDDGVCLDWELPEWKEMFTSEALKRFLEVADNEGIEVKGSAVEALSVDEEYHDEVFLIQDVAICFS